MSQRSYIVSGQHTFFHSTLHPLPLSVLYCFINLLLRKKMVLFLFYLLQTVIFYASHFVLVWSAGKITNGTYSQFFFIPSFYASNMRNEASVKIRAVHFNVYLSEIIVVNMRNGELVKILCAWVNCDRFTWKMPTSDEIKKMSTGLFIANSYLEYNVFSVHSEIKISLARFDIGNLGTLSTLGAISIFLQHIGMCFVCA